MECLGQRERPGTNEWLGAEALGMGSRILEAVGNGAHLCIKMVIFIKAGTLGL